MMHRAALLAALLLGGCDDYETGTVTFTTSGPYGERGQPVGEQSFADDWAVTFDKFLVNFHQVQLAAANGEIAQISPASYFVDNAVPGSKTLVSFGDVTAKAWDRVSYQIKPAVATAVVVAGEQSDLTMMVDAGYSLYLSGAATKGDVHKTFALGFSVGTQYSACRAGAPGMQVAGLVVTDGAHEVGELTTRADHVFYDRLPAAGGAEASASLRFEAFAAADDAGDADAAITIAELERQAIDDVYDTSELTAENMYEFAAALARRVGIFRGEGECSISDAE